MTLQLPTPATPNNALSAGAQLADLKRRAPHSMNKVLLSFLLFATTTGFAASELTTVDDPRRFYSHFTGQVSVDASDDSVTVTAPKARYCEVFFKSNGTFMDGADHERFAHDALLDRSVMSPR
jgi:hypothetical protein